MVIFSNARLLFMNLFCIRKVNAPMELTAETNHSHKRIRHKDKGIND